MGAIFSRRTVSLFFGLAALAGLMLQSANTVLAGTILDTVGDESYLSKGSDYVSVGEFYYKTGNPRKPLFDFSASGIVIVNDETNGEAWVLTAAHVVDKSTYMIFSLDGVQNPDAQVYQATEWYAHPDWTGRVSDGSDIGLVKFNTSIEVEPAMYAVSDYEPLSPGATVTSVGFGMTGTGVTGAVEYDGNKRAGQNIVDYIDTLSNVFFSDFDAPGGLEEQYEYDGTVDVDPYPLDLEFLIASGDSGGGVFDDQGVLVGINSFLWAPTDNQPDADYGDLSGHTLVSAFADWIYGVIAGDIEPPVNDPPGGGKKPKKTFLSSGQFYTVEQPIQGTAVPEPSTFAMLATGLAAWLIMGIRRLSSL